MSSPYISLQKSPRITMAELKQPQLLLGALNHLKKVPTFTFSLARQATDTAEVVLISRSEFTKKISALDPAKSRPILLNEIPCDATWMAKKAEEAFYLPTGNTPFVPDEPRGDILSDTCGFRASILRNGTINVYVGENHTTTGGSITTNHPIDPSETVKTKTLAGNVANVITNAALGQVEIDDSPADGTAVFVTYMTRRCTVLNVTRNGTIEAVMVAKSLIDFLDENAG